MVKTTWIRCPGCSGEIGVPPDWPAEVACCPKCAAVVRIDERMRVLWRPNCNEADSEGCQGDVSIRWIACHGCGGEIGAPPSWLGSTIACPKCGAIAAIDEAARVLWRPPNAEAKSTATPEPKAVTSPEGAAEEKKAGTKSAAGIWAIAIGLVGFIGSAAVSRGRDLGSALVTGALNPLFFIGVPLGWYWLRSNRSAASATEVTNRWPAPPHRNTPAANSIPVALTSPRTPVQPAVENTISGQPPVEMGKGEIGCVIASVIVAFLFVVVMAFGVAYRQEQSGANESEAGRSPSEQKAIAFVERFGGSIHRLKGEGEVVGVDLVGAPVDDADLAAVIGFERLQSLDVSGTDVSDASVDTILKLKHLRSLRADGTGITHAGFKRLREEGRFVLADARRYKSRAVHTWKDGRMLERPCVDPIDVRELEYRSLEYGSKEVWLTTRPMTE